MENSALQIKDVKTFYRGKVRDVYTFDGDKVAMIASDRISAFDVVLPRPIPYKGQVLTQIAAYYLNALSGLVPNWLEGTFLGNVSVGKLCKPFPVEMVIRGCLVGHAWRLYANGERVICGVPMPDGLVENQQLPTPIITPTTKEAEGHDQDISRDAIISQGIVDANHYAILEEYTRLLFNEGTHMAAQKGLILCDTKYEFGLFNGQVMLMDEIHTPDSSRYFYSDGYADRLAKGLPQRQLSKEFVRQWLIENGFQGQEGQIVPEMTDAKVEEISQRYQELYLAITGKHLEKQMPIEPSKMAKTIEDWAAAQRTI